MGNSISLTPDADSVTSPGEKCVLSDELPLAYDDLVDGIIEVLSDPTPLYVRPAMKATEVVKKSEDEFTVKVILDGQKLTNFGYGDGKGSDKVSTWMKVTRTEDTIMTESYLKNGTEGDWMPDASDAAVSMTTVAKLLKDPVRLEYWMVNPEKERLTGQPVADILALYLQAIVELKKNRKVKCTPELDSLKEPGKKSVISDPMDDFTTYDKLFDALNDYSKEFTGAEIQQLSEKELHVTGEGGVETPAGSLDVFYDKETGEICRTHTVAGKLIEKRWGVLHKEPLQFEAWRESSDGSREAGKMLAKTLEVYLDTKIAELSSWF